MSSTSVLDRLKRYFLLPAMAFSFAACFAILFIDKFVTIWFPGSHSLWTNPILLTAMLFIGISAYCFSKHEFDDTFLPQKQDHSHEDDGKKTSDDKAEHQHDHGHSHGHSHGPGGEKKIDAAAAKKDKRNLWASATIFTVCLFVSLIKSELTIYFALPGLVLLAYLNREKIRNKKERWPAIAVFCLALHAAADPWVASQGVWQSFHSYPILVLVFIAGFAAELASDAPTTLAASDAKPASTGSDSDGPSKNNAKRWLFYFLATVLGGLSAYGCYSEWSDAIVNAVAHWGHLLTPGVEQIITIIATLASFLVLWSKLGKCMGDNDNGGHSHGTSAVELLEGINTHYDDYTSNRLTSWVQLLPIKLDSQERKYEQVNGGAQAEDKPDQSNEGKSETKVPKEKSFDPLSLLIDVKDGVINLITYPLYLAASFVKRILDDFYQCFIKSKGNQLYKDSLWLLAFTTATAMSLLGCMECIQYLDLTLDFSSPLHVANIALMVAFVVAGIVVEIALFYDSLAAVMGGNGQEETKKEVASGEYPDSSHTAKATRSDDINVPKQGVCATTSQDSDGKDDKAAPQEKGDGSRSAAN
jgi:hypothetical protein